ncbi:hypothetical protein BC829DRAFT_113135 [Chytridium lagenaria]|nr:hypothetical protein BC829DRAFT_113135 [Chytridium lagenaria]
MQSPVHPPRPRAVAKASDMRHKKPATKAKMRKDSELVVETLMEKTETVSKVESGPPETLLSESTGDTSSSSEEIHLSGEDSDVPLSEVRQRRSSKELQKDDAGNSSDTDTIGAIRIREVKAKARRKSVALEKRQEEEGDVHTPIVIAVENKGREPEGVYEDVFSGRKLKRI